MQDDDDGRPVARDRVEQREHFVRVADVEVAGRLVQQHHPCALGEGERDPRSLPLARTQRAERPVGQSGEAHPGDRVRAGRGVVVGPPPVPPLVMGEAAGRDGLPHGERRFDRLIDEDRDRSGAFRRPERGDRGSVELDAPRLRLRDARKRAQERRLPGAVGPDDRGEQARLGRKRCIVEERTGARGEADAGRRQAPHSRAFPVGPR